LLEYLEGRTQTFITTSKESLVEQFIAQANIYRASEGMITGGARPQALISSAAGTAESI
jgi:hypothetical protein